MQPEEAVIQAWSGAAPYWEKHRETIRRIFAPVTEALAADARIARGQVILDMATGPGEPALTLAAAAGPTGRVHGIDPVPEMIAAARRTAKSLGVENAEFDVAFADRLPFPDGCFDAVVSRFGVMFFASPRDGIREMLRVLKPGGRIALAVWRDAERNPFLSALNGVFSQYFESPPLPPDAPETFRFAAPGKLPAIVREAGATEAAERLFPFTIDVPLSIEECWTLRCEMSEKLRRDLATLAGEQAREVKRQSLAVLRAYSTGSGMSFPAEAWIVSGRKST